LRIKDIVLPNMYQRKSVKKPYCHQDTKTPGITRDLW